MFRQFPLFGVTPPLPSASDPVEVNYLLASTTYYLDKDATEPGEPGNPQKPYRNLGDIHFAISQREEDFFDIVQIGQDSDYYIGDQFEIPNRSISYHNVKVEMTSAPGTTKPGNIALGNSNRNRKFQFYNGILKVTGSTQYFAVLDADIVFHNSRIELGTSNNIETDERSSIVAKSISGTIKSLNITQTNTNNSCFWAEVVDLVIESCSISQSADGDLSLFRNINLPSRIHFEEFSYTNQTNSNKTMTICRGAVSARISFGKSILYYATNAAIYSTVRIYTNEENYCEFDFKNTVIDSRVSFYAGVQSLFTGSFTYDSPDNGANNYGISGRFAAETSKIVFERFDGYATDIEQSSLSGLIVVKNSTIRYPSGRFIIFDNFDGDSNVYLHGVNYLEGPVEAFATENEMTITTDTNYSVLQPQLLDIIAVCPNTEFTKKFNNTTI